MPNLKTDYKNAIPLTEHRKYQIINNPDGTVSLVDVTTYEQVGDTFGAGDINNINTTVNGKSDKPSLMAITLAASDWTGTGPWSQTKTVPGYDPATKIARNGFPEGYTDEQIEAYGKCGVKMAGKALNSITFQASKKKPEIDIPILIEVGDRYVE